MTTNTGGSPSSGSSSGTGSPSSSGASSTPDTYTVTIEGTFDPAVSTAQTDLEAALQPIVTAKANGVTTATLNGSSLLPVDPYADLDAAVADLETAAAPLASGSGSSSTSLTGDQTAALVKAVDEVKAAADNLDPVAVLPTAPSTPGDPVGSGTPAAPADPTAPVHTTSDGGAVAV